MINPKNSKLKVTPVKRYKVAKYPSFEDPNPLEHPDTLPYPFSEKAFKLLCGLGFTGALLLGCTEETGKAYSEFISFVKRDTTTGNPFTEEMTGLPYRPSGFGTGLPSRVNRENAIEIINRVFREEGIALESMVDVEKDGVVVTAEGYNKEMQLGYVFIDYGRLGEDTVVDNGFSRKKRKFNDTYKSETRYPNIEHYKDKEGSGYKHLVKKDTPQNKAFINFIDEIYPTLGPLQKENRFKRANLTLRIQNTLEEIAPFYPTYTSDLRQSMEKPDRFSLDKLEKILSTVYALRQVGAVFPKLTESVLVTELINSIDQSDERWSKQINNLYVLIYLNKQINNPYKLRRSKNVASNTQNDRLEQLIEAVFTKSGTAQQEVFKEIEHVLNFNKIDLSEVKSIVKAAEEREYFLAPISYLNPRLTYPNVSRPTERQIQKIEQRLEEETDPMRRERTKKVLDEMKLKMKEKKIDPREKTLKTLEEQVRNYIHWSKGQMGY